MKLLGQIERFKPYRPLFEPKYETFDSLDLDDIASYEGTLPNNFWFRIDTETYAVSKWKGPKRSRTYPYALVYNTLMHKPRVTLIPFVKDEGANGDRDYIQWDTVQMMSFLGIYVILTYHNHAVPSDRPGKITGHEIDRAYLCERLEELGDYVSDPMHWNNSELSLQLRNIAERSVSHYRRIERETGITLHSWTSIESRIADLDDYKEKSRQYAESAQSRESSMVHASERVAHGTKATVTIQDDFEGKYYFTADEVFIFDGTAFLIEKKNTKPKKLPSASDIKDALVKLALFHHLDTIMEGGTRYPVRIVLGLTSESITGWCHNLQQSEAIQAFMDENEFTAANRRVLASVFQEGTQNQIFVYLIEQSAESKMKVELLRLAAP